MKSVSFPLQLSSLHACIDEKNMVKVMPYDFRG